MGGPSKKKQGTGQNSSWQWGEIWDSRKKQQKQQFIACLGNYLIFPSR